jgi:hypothetical protein
LKVEFFLSFFYHPSYYFALLCCAVLCCAALGFILRFVDRRRFFSLEFRGARMNEECREGGMMKKGRGVEGK